MTMSDESKTMVMAQYSAGSCARSAFIWKDGQPVFAPFGVLGRVYRIEPDEPPSRFIRPIRLFCKLGMLSPILLAAGAIWRSEILWAFVGYTAFWVAAYVTWVRWIARDRFSDFVEISDAR